MAKARGMELPDVLRMMLTKAVLSRSFSLDLAKGADQGQAPKEREQLNPFEPRYGGPCKTTIDAELALALLQRSVADASARRDEARQADPQDQHENEHENEHERFDRERQEAQRLLADFDVADMSAIAGVLKRMTGTPASLPAPAMDLHPGRRDGGRRQGETASWWSAAFPTSPSARLPPPHSHPRSLPPWWSWASRAPAYRSWPPC
ncbi:hypothetical protein QTH97_26225 [Variovorax sp. J22R24]|uniref:hypothetical protein n=1 Tax=Variovorax gracilis TaxID=3053502 RepID=UPI0025767B7B|nr:hypothetical protein [Variovorax sp. J22R24]MDM0108473.1 hypothetical protein [Variovorax sp. J22R24]